MMVVEGPSSLAGAVGWRWGQSAHCAAVAWGRHVGSGAPRQPHSWLSPRGTAPRGAQGGPHGGALGRCEHSPHTAPQESSHFSPGARQCAVSCLESVIFKLLGTTHNKSFQNRICPQGRFNC